MFIDNEYTLLVEQFRIFQRNNRFITEAHGSGLGLTESHLLIEVSGNPELTAKDFVEIVGLDQSSVSRTVNGLTKRKLLVQTPSPADKRRKNLSLSPEGKEAVKSKDKQSEKMIEQFESNLSSSERKTLLHYLTLLADGLEGAKSVVRKEESPFRPQIRRLTRVLGFLGNDFMESSISSAQWQLLTEISNFNGTISSLELGKIMNLAPTTISINLSRLEDAGLISKTLSETDKRKRELELSTTGRKVLAEISQRANKRLSLALESLSSKELEQFLSLLKRFVRIDSSDDNYSFAPISSDKERHEARVLCIQNLVDNNLTSHIRETVLSKTNPVFGLYVDYKI